jgi:hypothetical protein
MMTWVFLDLYEFMYSNCKFVFSSGYSSLKVEKEN